MLWESIFLGVASGALTSGLLLLLSVFFRDSVLPWYRQISYKGIDISGEWVSTKENPSGNIQESSMVLNQKANKLKCVMTIFQQSKDSEERIIKTFRLSGRIEDRIVVLSGKNTNPKELGFHSELLELTGGGNVLEGYASWFSTSQKVIQSVQINWTRK